MNKLTLLLFLGLAIGPYSSYLEINTINCDVNEKDHKKIVKLLAYERMFFNEIFSTQKNDSVPIKINLFGKLKDFKMAKASNNISKQVVGFYSSNANEAFVYKSDEYLSVTLHEASHCLIESNYKRPPRWLNEGLAEFFETFDLDSNGELFSYPQEGRISSIKAGIALKDSTRLKAFFKMNSGSFYTEGIQDNYSTAYSIIYYFIRSKNSEALKKIIGLMKIGNSTENAFAITFGSFEAFEERYKMFYYYYSR